MDLTVIKPYEEISSKIYAYTLPDVPSHRGYVKIGQTSRTAEERVREQIGTAGLNANILFEKLARRSDGEWFSDKDLHRFLILNQIPKAELNRYADEWFFFNDCIEKAEILTDKFINRDYDMIHISDDKVDYILRDEQRKAVEYTLKYYNSGKEPREFLWNAKPRFGKTLTAYDFVRKIEAINVLIVTNRPAIADSWFNDFQKFIAWQEPHMRFISETEALRDKALTRQEFLDQVTPKNQNHIAQITFISLQDLKGAKFAGGEHDKLEWVTGLNWDLLIIDEAHEGVDTPRTDLLFNEITRGFTLHLSGTPFKALASNKFNKDQIFNWSYMDEQEAKSDWDYTLGTNPYEDLPRLNLFTYQMSKIVEERVSRGLTLDDEASVDFAFDLNEFFRVKDNGRFEYEDSVKRFLDNLCSGKFPFAPGQHKEELQHTFWLLPRVNSAKALEVLLKKHSVFKDYYVVLAAGDGISIDAEAQDLKRNEQSLQRVRDAIAKHEKTITLSVGQLTTGVTIPEWSAVLMLSNIKSPSLYFQAAFRAQNPYVFSEGDKQYRKENAYVFDFAPERTLVLFDEFANNLVSGGNARYTAERKENIKKLLNFFPVIGEDEDGEMHELDASEVLTIPARIISREVVKRGFMSNLLFANITGIFSGNAILKEILEKLPPEQNKRLKKPSEFEVTDPLLDEEGEVSIPEEIVINETKDLFGPSIYQIIETSSVAELDVDGLDSKMDQVIDTGFQNFGEKFKLTKGLTNEIKKEARAEVRETIKHKLKVLDDEIEKLDSKFTGKIELAKKKRDTKEVEKLEQNLEEEKAKLTENTVNQINEEVSEVLEGKVENQLEQGEEDKKKTTEDEVRSRLRGFARTIPAFLMAYGDETTTLANFDEHIDEDTFSELTGITLAEFRKLRDGFDYVDEEGNNRKQTGVFNGPVFNASIREFFATKKRLANYFDENLNEDIFDYIPPQRTNQIFTPRKVVKMMVDVLEENNPEIFSDYTVKFLDPYAKSGMYITEIVRRLYEGLREQIPNSQERLKWILENQVYALAPSNIIYNIVKNYVLSDFEGISTKNIAELDLVEYIDEELDWKQLIQEAFGGEELKFDVIIGNPPYQTSDGGDDKEGVRRRGGAMPLYHKFVQAGKLLKPRYLAMIIPSRWFAGGRGLDDFRKEMLNDDRIRHLVDYPVSAECFPGLEIKGGVCYFLWDRENKGLCKVKNVRGKLRSSLERPLLEKGSEIFLRYNASISIYRKVRVKNEPSFAELVSSQKPFGFRTYFQGDSKKSSDSIKIYTNRGFQFVAREKVTQNADWVDKHKVYISMAYGAGEDFPHQIINKPFYGEPASCCTETFLVIGPFETQEIAYNVLSYVATRFFRFMVMLRKNTQHAARGVYSFVPIQDFSQKWNDAKLYEKYEITKGEVKFIESMVRPMDIEID